MTPETEPLIRGGLTALIVVVAAFAAYQVGSRALKLLTRRSALSPQIALILRRTLQWGIIITAVFLVLQSAGILNNAWAMFTAVLGLVAIGFVAVWSVLSNVLCALVLLITRSYRVGDVVAFPTDDLEGVVVDFNVIFTTLQDTDGALIQIPNNLFLQKPIRRRPGVGGLDLQEQLTRESAAKPRPVD
jgi:small-conductance mechanosensitive channel